MKRRKRRAPGVDTNALSERTADNTWASHLFEEPGTLEQVANLAAEWFELHLGRKYSESTQG
jgi:hypothetical protein